MDIRQIIREEIGKIFSENYPLGAANDPSAPWNQVDNTREGDKASVIKYRVVWTDNEFSFLKDAAGNVYVFYIDSVDKSDLEPYADREESYAGRDEDGDPIIDYGDWEITDEVIENYINDNLDSIAIGKGLDDYESGDYNLVMMDDEVRQELLRLTKYIKDDRTREKFIKVVSGQVNESGVTDKIVNKKTMDTPTGTLFVMDFGTSDE